MVTFSLVFISSRIPGFINKIYVVNSLINAVLAVVTNIYFLKITAESQDDPDDSTNCMMYIIAWLLDVDFLIIGNVSIMFCRFAYIKYAEGDSCSS